ncbi:MAG: hypothetical protein ABUL44_04170, partial [Flavobacterium sp.]
MRLLILMLLLPAIMGFNNLRNVKFGTPELNGTWIPTQQEFSGTSLPPTAFEKQKLIITDTLYTLIAESVDKGELKYADGKMDIYGKEGINTGKHFAAIYKYENEQLTICYNLKGDS